MNSRIGGSIAVGLLAIYVYLIVRGCVMVDCIVAPACTRWRAQDFNDNMTQYLAELAGLVSALVIAELAITRPGETPATRVLAADASEASRRRLRIVTATYLVVWFLAGFAAFMIGMAYPKALPPLTSVGQSWIGIAITAAYAYFGVGRAQAGA
jgi:hypothetical protein